MNTLMTIMNRFITTIPLIIGITFISFCLMVLAPGDPTSIFMDPNLSAADRATLKNNLGLNDPLYKQYGTWLINVCKGNLGYSHITGKPVTTLIGERIGPTLLLSITSLIGIVLITLPLGLLSGARKNSLFDHLTTLSTFIGMAIPTFWLGLLLILTFSLKFNLFPTSGFLDPALLDASIWKKILNIAHHMVLPLITIIIGGTASLTRYHRFGIIDILSQDYIKAAKARGIADEKILFVHAFKNAALPIITILGLSLPGLISGSFIIEYIFAWPGMGSLGLEAVFKRDYPVLMGTLLCSSFLIILGNLLADIAYSKIDPRIARKH